VAVTLARKTMPYLGKNSMDIRVRYARKTGFLAILWHGIEDNYCRKAEYSMEWRQYSVYAMPVLSMVLFITNIMALVSFIPQ